MNIKPSLCSVLVWIKDNLYCLKFDDMGPFNNNAIYPCFSLVMLNLSDLPIF